MKVKEIWPVQSESPSIVSFFTPIAKLNVIRFATSSTSFIPNMKTNTIVYSCIKLITFRELENIFSKYEDDYESWGSLYSIHIYHNYV